MLEGTILEVMESWPLQLLLESGASRYSVGLTEATVVMRRGQPVGAGELLPGLFVRIIGKTSPADGAAVCADRIEILD